VQFDGTVPTVLDRFIQQAALQVLQADWDGTFSETSFGFRPGHSAHQAVEQAQAYIASGHGFVVDIDLEKFLDVASYCTFSFFERVEEAQSNCRYLNSYAFCPSAIDVNGLKLSALYTLQDGLSRDAE
jgi:Reverse transcriptase (RNA-dependent DNA polymerase)